MNPQKPYVATFKIIFSIAVIWIFSGNTSCLWAQSIEKPKKSEYHGPVKTVKMYQLKFCKFDRKSEKQQPITEKEFQLLEKDPKEAMEKHIRYYSTIEFEEVYDTAGYQIWDDRKNYSHSKGDVCLTTYDEFHRKIKETWYSNKNSMDTPTAIKTWKINDLGLLEEVYSESRYDGKKTTRYTYNEKGQMLIMQVVDGKNRELEKTSNVYNNKGELVQMVETGEDDILRRKKIITYNEAGFKTGEITFDSDGEFMGKRVFVEDTAKNLLVEYYYSSYGELETYDSTWFDDDGKKIKYNEGRYDAYYFWTYEYDDKGRKISQHEKSQRFEDSIPAFFITTYYPETGEQQVFIIQKGEEKTEFVYDSTGRRTSRIKTVKNQKITEEYWNDEKNGDNKVVKKEKGKIVEETVNKVTYDQYGNILRVVEIENGLIGSGIEFEYEYYTK